MSKSCFESCLAKQQALKQIFALLPSPDQKYQKIMELGSKLPLFPRELELPDNIVKGCQSVMYLHADLLPDGKISFLAGSEALISKGLAALLLSIYNQESPEVILTCPPNCFDAIGIQASLSPSRSNGLASLYLKMKQEAIRFLQTQSICK